ncbi:hypothetical protein N0V83_010186 [Neocucurbitaria cava]|uniref:Uncharacterized protein n=1 Tax=Neocucurbitaria cava TaxID=798079 RepID=A0A9W8Y1H0_9PLEO|nr:hypothetical protein N0V83_010186 [Neocucurbitaria cava]
MSPQRNQNPKSPFTFRTLFTLFTGAKSTRWPGASRFASPLLVVTLVLALALLAVNLPLGISLLRIGTQVSCWHINEDGGDWYLLEGESLPVTFIERVDLSTEVPWVYKEFMSMGENRGRVDIALTAFIIPTSIIIILTTQITMHFRSITNRMGMYFATALLTLFIVFNTQDHWLNIDSNKAMPDWRLCIKTPDEFDAIRAERKMRAILLLAGEVLGGLGGLWKEGKEEEEGLTDMNHISITLYFVLATTAASANRHDAQHQSTRLQTLRSSPSSSAPTPTSPSPSSSAPTLPTMDFGLTTVPPPSAAVKEGQQQRMTAAAERRERAHMETNRSAAVLFENPFVDPGEQVLRPSERKQKRGNKESGR